MSERLYRTPALDISEAVLLPALTPARTQTQRRLLRLLRQQYDTAAPVRVQADAAGQAAGGANAGRPARARRAALHHITRPR